MHRRISHGNRTLAFATKPIAEGEEITDAYCATFASAPIEKRRHALKKYNFECACAACRGRWGLLNYLPQKLSGAACLPHLSAAEAKTQAELLRD